MSGAFARTRALGAYIKKVDVPMQYTNWWKKVHPVQAEVSDAGVRLVMLNLTAVFRHTGDSTLGG